MLASADVQRTRLFVMIDAGVRTSPSTASIVQDFIFSYLREKVPGLPQNIFELDSYDHESGLLATEQIQEGSIRIWSSRFSEPDSTVPGRSWSLELTLGTDAQSTSFGSRLSCFSRNLDFNFTPAVPRVYRELVSQQILYGDGIRLSRTPIDITNDGDVEWFIALLKNPRRQRNIIALSAEDNGVCTANPNLFADRLCGVAHVVRIYPQASFKLSDSIGKYLSIFDLGIRIYRPTAQLESDDPLRHTLYTRRALTLTNLDRVQHSILSDAFMTSVEGALSSRAIPSFAQIRSSNSNLKLSKLQKRADSKGLASLESQLKASQKAREAAEAQARESLDLAVQEETARKEAEDQRNQEKVRAMVLAARVRALELRVGSNANISARCPDEYPEIAPWVEHEFAGRMSLHARALRGLRDATYNNIALVCKLLQLLATEYVDSKRGDRDANKRFEDGIQQDGVEFSKSISITRAGELACTRFRRHRVRCFDGAGGESWKGEGLHGSSSLRLCG